MIATDDEVPARSALGRSLTFIFLTALAARLLHVLFISDTPLYEVPHGDGKAYLALAERIRSEGLSGGTEPFYQAPLYPYFLAAVQTVFGTGLTTIRVLQAIMGAGTAVLVGVAGARAFGHRAGHWAGLGVALFPTSIWLDGLIQKSALAGLLFAAAMALAVGRGARSRWALGAVLGLLMLTRGEARLFLAVVLMDLALRRSWRGVAAVTLGAVLTLAPVMLRNGLIAGEWLLTTSQAGTNLYIGNQEGTSGTYAPLVPGRGDAELEAADARRLAEAAEGHVLTASEVSAHWQERAIEEFASDPLHGTGRIARKAALAWNNAEVADTDDLYHAKQSSLALRFPLGFGLLSVLGVLGALAMTREERSRGRVILGFIGAQTISLAAFYVFARYRLPIALGLAPFAGLAVARWPAVLQPPRIALPAAAAAALLAWWPLHDRSGGLATAACNEGQVFIGRKDHAAAESCAREALNLAPEMFTARRLMGRALIAQQRATEALPFLQAAHGVRPDDWQLSWWLGLARRGTGDSRGALDVIEAVALDRPDALPITTNALTLAVELREAARAVRIAEARLIAEPETDSVYFRMQLAWIRSTHRDASLRNGDQALLLLGPLGDRPSVLSVRAAAHAEVGDFTEALRCVQVALATRRQEGAPRDRLQERLEAQARDFERGRPHRSD